MPLFRWLMVPGLLALAVSLGNAGPARFLSDPARDVRQTIEARQILADDPELASWNIGVTVHDCVATLWGPVPSAEVAFCAELCLRSIIELADVRNDLIVSDALEPRRTPWKIDSTPLFPPHVPRLQVSPSALRRSRTCALSSRRA